MDQREFSKRFAGSSSRQEKVTLLDAYAEQLFENENYAQACRHYTQAFHLEKQRNVRAYFAGQIGICRYNAGEDGEALRYLLRSTRLFQPDQPEFMPDMYGFVYFYLGSLYEYHGRVQKSLEARRVCEQYIDSQEKDTKWMLFAGMSRNYELLGMHDESIRYSQKALQVLSDNDPGLTYVYETMGNNYMRLKQYSEAIKHFSKVLELDPNFERRDDIYLKIAESYHKLTNHQRALESYQKILELKQLTGDRKNLPALYIQIAHCHFRLDQFEKSLLVTLEGLRRQPKDKTERAELRSYLTNNYHEMGRYRDAVEEGLRTLKVARRFHGDSIFYVRLALSYYKLGDKKNFKLYRSLCRRRFRSDSWIAYLEKLM